MPPWSPFVAHVLFWLPFIVRGQVDRMRGRADGPPVHAAPGARRLIAKHSFATLSMYLGLGSAVARKEVLDGAPAAAGIALIALGLALALWTLWVFRSWRLRAELGPGHELCTDGPFRLVRHPIYTAMDLLALGTAVWAPNALTAGGLLGIALIGDQRARAEEQILLEAFGERYALFMASTRRFVPGIY